MGLGAGVFFSPYFKVIIDIYVTESDKIQIYSKHLIKYRFCWFEIWLVSGMVFLVSTPIATSTSKLPSEIVHCYKALKKNETSL